MIRLISLEHKDLDRVMEIERKSFSSNTWEEKDVYEKRINTFSQGNLGIWQEDRLFGFICSELWKFEEIYEAERFMLSHNIEDYHSDYGDELNISSFAIDKNFSSKGLGKLSFDKFLMEWNEPINSVYNNWSNCSSCRLFTLVFFIHCCIHIN